MLTFPDLNGAFVLKYYPLIFVCVCMVMPWFTDIHPLTCIDSGIEGVTFTWKNNIRDMGRYWKGQVTISGTKSQQERIRPFHLTSVDFNNFLNANTWWQSSAHCWILHAEVFFFLYSIEMDLDFSPMPSDNALRQRAESFLTHKANLDWKLSGGFWSALVLCGGGGGRHISHSYYQAFPGCRQKLQAEGWVSQALHSETRDDAASFLHNSVECSWHYDLSSSHRGRKPAKYL